MNTIQILIKEPGKRAWLERVENTIENLQEIVGGYIETIRATNDFAILYNKDAYALGFPEACKICGIELFGTIALVGQRGKNFTDLSHPLLEKMRALFPQLFEGV